MLKKPWINYLFTGLLVTAFIIYLFMGGYETQTNMEVSTRGVRRLLSVGLAFLDRKIGPVGVYGALTLLNLVMYYMAYSAFKNPEKHKDD